MVVAIAVVNTLIHPRSYSVAAVAAAAVAPPVVVEVVQFRLDSPPAIAIADWAWPIWSAHDSGRVGPLPRKLHKD